MIRRSVGDEFWLIDQHAHAVLSGQLARRVGNQQFASPTPAGVLGTELHDCGWPLHDTDAPTLNSRGQPQDVFESSREIALMVWQESVDRALDRDPYAALLVSLHVLSLSVGSTAPGLKNPDKFDASHAKARFEINRFQHKQIETQELLRRQLGQLVDVPFRNGLAEGSGDPREQSLQFDFRMLQTMDMLSLGLCCTQPPTERIQNVLTRAGAGNSTMVMRRTADAELAVNPWPFDSDPLDATVPYRAIPAARYASVEEFRQALAACRRGTVKFRLKGV
jgi:hypothetical protein